jgi:hypothetical protein
MACLLSASSAVCDISMKWSKRAVCRRRRPLEGEAPTIDVAVGYSKSNTSPMLKLFPSRLDELVGPNQPS